MSSWGIFEYKFIFVDKFNIEISLDALKEKVKGLQAALQPTFEKLNEGSTNEHYTKIEEGVMYIKHGDKARYLVYHVKTADNEMRWYFDTALRKQMKAKADEKHTSFDAFCKEYKCALDLSYKHEASCYAIERLVFGPTGKGVYKNSQHVLDPSAEKLEFVPKDIETNPSWQDIILKNFEEFAICCNIIDAQHMPYKQIAY